MAFSNMFRNVREGTYQAKHGKAHPDQRKREARAKAERDRVDPTNPYAPKFDDWQLSFDMPGRVDMLNSDGTLKSQYELDVTSARPESAWYQNEASRQGNLYSQAQDNALSQNLASVQGAQDNLAATGGLSSGARERLSGQGVLANSNSMTGLANQHSQNLYGLRSQDIGQQINADQWNIGNSLNEVNNKYNADLGAFDITASAYGNEQLANAYAQMGGGGGGGKGKPVSQVAPGSYKNRQRGPEKYGSYTPKSTQDGAGSDNEGWMDQMKPSNWSYNGQSFYG